MSYWICVVQDICPITVQMKVSPCNTPPIYKTVMFTPCTSDQCLSGEYVIITSTHWGQTGPWQWWREGVGWLQRWGHGNGQHDDGPWHSPCWSHGHQKCAGDFEQLDRGERLKITDVCSWLLNIPSHATVSQGRICSDDCPCNHSEIKVAD